MASIDELDFIPPERTTVAPLSQEELRLLSQNEQQNEAVSSQESSKDRFHRLAEEPIVYVTIGRMNPPTTGHKGLIKTMIKMALKDGLTQINIILSSTVDSTKNILEDETKRGYLYEMIENSVYSEVLAELQEEYEEDPDKIAEFEALLEDFWVEIVCMKDPTHEEHGNNPITKSLKYILWLYNKRGHSQREIRLVVGEDRTKNDDFGWLDRCFPDDTFTIVPLSRPEGSMSATYIRELIASGKKEEYMTAMAPTGLSETSLHEIYEEIHRYLSSSSGIRRKKINKRTKKRRASKKRKTHKKRYKSKKTRYYIHGRKKRG